MPEYLSVSTLSEDIERDHLAEQIYLTDPGVQFPVAPQSYFH